jgi:arylsulfatase
VSNTPFREYKHWVHEGGISTPLIAHWPAGISRERRGQLVRAPGHLIDLLATCIDLGGAKYPALVNGEKIHPLEGISLRPAFTGKPLGRKQPIFWEHEGNRAIRDGKWKLVARHAERWELYDIDADRVESNDLASKMPEKVAQLKVKYDDWARRAWVLPWPVVTKKSKAK